MGTTETAIDGASPASDLLGARRYLSYYGLEAPPFRTGADPRFLWLGSAQQSVLARLAQSIRERDGIVILTGDVAAGKTVLANRLALDLGDAAFVVGRLLGPGSDPAEFFHAVLSAYGLPADVRGRAEFDAALQGLIDTADSDGKRVLLIIDEAQGVSRAVLREIRELATGQRHGLAVLLVGQTELNARISEARDLVLERSIVTCCTLMPLGAEEVASYIQHCLRMAGSEEDLFTALAVREIARLSRGAPGAINIICDRALLAGHIGWARPITGAIVKECCRRPGSPGPAAARRVQPSPSLHVLAGRTRAFLGGSFTRRRAGLAAGLLVVMLGVIGAPSLSPSRLVGLGRARQTPADSPRAPAVPTPAPERTADLAGPAMTEHPVVTPTSAALPIAPEERPAVEAPRPSLPPVNARAITSRPTPSVRIEYPRAQDTPRRDEPRRRDIRIAAPAPIAPSPIAPEPLRRETTEAPARAHRAADGRADSPDPGAVIDWLMKESPGR